MFSSDGKQRFNLLGMPDKILRSYRGKQLAMIFQEPMTSLNPLMTCGAQVCEPLIQHKNLDKTEARCSCTEIV